MKKVEEKLVSFTLLPEVASKLQDEISGEYPQAVVVLLTGSHAVGLSRTNSDLDIGIISAIDSQWNTLPTRTYLRSLNQYVDIKVFGLRGIRKNAATLLRHLNCNSHEIAQSISQDLLINYGALTTSIPISDSKGIWKAVLKDLQPGVFAEILVKWHQGWAEILRETANFALILGDWELIDAVVRSFVGHAADSYLASKGELYVSRKYRWAKAHRISLSDKWLAELWRFHASPPSRKRKSFEKRIMQADEWISSFTVWHPSNNVTVPSTISGVSLEKVAGEAIVRLGTSCWIPDPIEELIWPSLKEAIPLEKLTAEYPSLSFDELLAALRSLMSAGLLDIPHKIGRWATWV